jgi:hypothetical protein
MFLFINLAQYKINQYLGVLICSFQLQISWAHQQVKGFQIRTLKGNETAAIIKLAAVAPVARLKRIEIAY